MGSGLMDKQLKISGRVSKEGAVYYPITPIDHRFHSAAFSPAIDKAPDTDDLAFMLHQSAEEGHAQKRIVQHFGKWTGGLIISIAKRIAVGRPLLHFERVLSAIESEYTLEDILEFQMSDLEEWGERM